MLGNTLQNYPQRCAADTVYPIRNSSRQTRGITRLRFCSFLGSHARRYALPFSLL